MKSGLRISSLGLGILGLGGGAIGIPGRTGGNEVLISPAPALISGGAPFGKAGLGGLALGGLLCLGGTAGAALLAGLATAAGGSRTGLASSCTSSLRLNRIGGKLGERRRTVSRPGKSGLFL